MTSPGVELVVRGLHAVRRSTIWWGIGIAGLALLNVSFWPSFEDSSGLKELGEMSEGLLEAFGAQNIATPSGYLDGQMYALMLPLLLSGMAIAQVTALTAGDEDAGRLELLHALPVSRRAVWLRRFAAVVIAQALVAALTAALVAGSLDLFSLEEVGRGRVIVVTFACGLLALFHAAVGFLAGALGAHRGAAAGIGVLALVLGYVVSFLLPLADSLASAQQWSPWYWAIREQPVSTGVSGGGIALLAVVSASLVAAGLWAIERRDIRSA